MRYLILAAAAAITLGACQPAAEPEPVDAQAVPDDAMTMPMTPPPADTPEPVAEPQGAEPAAAAAPKASTPRPAPAAPAPTPAPAPPPADPMADHDMSQMGGMTMPPNE